jgi:hypothetical protein
MVKGWFGTLLKISRGVAEEFHLQVYNPIRNILAGKI